MKTEFKKPKFQPIILEITFETLEEMQFFAKELAGTYNRYIGELRQEVLNHIKKCNNDTNKG
jgi:hypothetical protein